MTLNRLSIGESAIVKSINADKELKHRFNSFGIVKGATVQVEKYSLAKKTMGVRINKTCLVLRNTEAEKIEIVE
jgi:ferrous iron transport protein A